MRSRSRRLRADSFAPALFPFLAVLVCTMGALVLILVLVVSQASASAKQNLQAEEDALLEASDMVEVASEEMKAQRKKQQEAIDNRRSQLAAIEDHIARLMDELKQLDQVAGAIRDQSTSTAPQQAEQAERSAILEKQLRDEQAKLDAIRSKAEKTPPAFAILPYAGNTGTTRRPIYLECTQHAVIIQPEGVAISIEDLKPPHGPGNPLDASLRLIRSAFQRLDPTASYAVSPYPLLLVRPDGIKAYVLARSAMKAWDDQFGYELIDQSMPLAFPPSVPGLSQQLIDNLEVARQRQMALIAAMPRKYRFENEWDEALDAIDNASDLGGSNSNPNIRRPVSTDWSSIDSDIANSNESPDWKMVSELPPYAGQGGYAGTQKNPPSSNELKPGTSTKPGGTTNTNPSASTQQDIQRMQQSALQGSMVSSGDLKANGLSRSNDDWQDPVTADNATTNSAQHGNASQLNNPSARNIGSSAGQPGSPTYPSAQPNMSMQTSNSGSAQSASTSNSFSSMTPSSQDPSQTPPPNSDTTPNISPSIDLSPRNTKQKSSDDANQKSRPPVRTWTSTRRSTNGTMVSRPITIVAMSDRWLVMRDDGKHQVESVVPLSIGPSAAGLQLEKAIEAHVEAWGVAVAGGYWQPKLNVEYAPDAGTSVQRLQKILDGSGLGVDPQPLR
ncbi:MAG: hypothetical protein SGI77_06850 [Pirellulaceae bacterium]|nr:hypothetical protein [Pirellulaceae bacterium]